MGIALSDGLIWTQGANPGVWSKADRQASHRNHTQAGFIEPPGEGARPGGIKSLLQSYESAPRVGPESAQKGHSRALLSVLLSGHSRNFEAVSATFGPPGVVPPARDPGHPSSGRTYWEGVLQDDAHSPQTSVRTVEH